jgi:hypothetical protein
MEFGRYSDIVLTYHNTTIADATHFSIYINCTGIWTVYIYFADALIFPQKVWQPWWDDPSGAEAWTPWTVNYDDWTEETGHGDLTCLIGTGPWIFHDWDVPAGAATLVANRAGAPYSEGNPANPGYWAGDFLRQDNNYDGIVDMKDVTAVLRAFGTIPAPPPSRWNYGQADVNSDEVVDIKDVTSVLRKYGRITL